MPQVTIKTNEELAGPVVMETDEIGQVAGGLNIQPIIWGVSGGTVAAPLLGPAAPLGPIIGGIIGGVAW